MSRNVALELLAREQKDDSLEAEARRIALASTGAQGAAWLVRTHRRGLHRHGVVEFKLPHPLPEKQSAEAERRVSIFLWAMEYLKQRRGWSVDVLTHRRRRVWRVRWLGWLRNARGVVSRETGVAPS